MITKLSCGEAIDKFGDAIESPKVDDIVLRVKSTATDPVGIGGDITHSRTITVVKIKKIVGSLLQGIQICEFNGDDDTSMAYSITGSCEFQDSEIATSVRDRLEKDRRFWS